MSVSSRDVVRVALLLVAVYVGVQVVWSVRGVLGLMFLALVIALMLSPAVASIERRGVRRAGAIALVYAALAALVFGVIALVVPAAISEMQAFLTGAPRMIEQIGQSQLLRPLEERWAISDALERAMADLPSEAGAITSTLSTVTIDAASTAFKALTVAVLAFFMLLDGERIARTAVGHLVPADHRSAVWSQMTDVYTAVARYSAGIVALALCSSAMALALLLLLGVPHALPLAALTFVLAFLPLVGIIVAAGVIALVALTVSWQVALAWTVLFTIYQQIEGNVLQPLVFRKATNLHPLVVIPTVLIGATQFGVPGALVAVPVAAAVQILLRAWWTPLRRSNAQGLPDEVPADTVSYGDHP